MRIVIGVLAASATWLSHAARPLDTDDAGVIAERACEIEGARTLTQARGDRASASGFGVACGLGFGSQLGLAYAKEKAGADRLQQSQLLGKTELWAAEGESAPALTLGWSLGWDKSGGKGWKHENTEGRLLGTLPLPGYSLHANLGHARAKSSGSRATVWGLAWELEAFSVGGVGLAPVAEVFGDDHGDRWTNIGLRLTVLPERLFLDLAFARQLVVEKARVRQVGFKLAF
jgi:hypothetical protein